MISWTIEVALKSPSIDRVIVSTDDEEIAAISRDWGADVPFMRPKVLAMDFTPGIEPVLHAIKKIPGFKQVLLLQPTSPLRAVEDIEGICQFQKNNTLCVVSVCSTSIPYLTYNTITKGLLEPLIKALSIKLNQSNLSILET